MKYLIFVSFYYQVIVDYSSVEKLSGVSPEGSSGVSPEGSYGVSPGVSPEGSYGVSPEGSSGVLPEGSSGVLLVMTNSVPYSPPCCNSRCRVLSCLACSV